MGVVFVRHGEDAAAAAGRYGDAGLSPRGRKQAQRLRQHLASLSFRGAHVSPLQRARETADLLLAGRDVDVAIRPDLAEGAIGELDGLTRAEAALRHPDALRRGPGVCERLAASGWTAPGGEARAEFLARARRMAGEAREELLKDGHLLVVSHGGLLNALLQHVFGMTPRDEVVFGFPHAGAVFLGQYPHAEPGSVSPLLWFYPPEVVEDTP